jgi:hypothetical protein
VIAIANGATLDHRVTRGAFLLEEIAGLDQQINRLIRRANAFPAETHQLMLAAAKVWRARKALEEALYQRRNRRISA